MLEMIIIHAGNPELPWNNFAAHAACLGRLPHCQSQEGLDAEGSFCCSILSAMGDFPVLSGTPNPEVSTQGSWTRTYHGLKARERNENGMSVHFQMF